MKFCIEVKVSLGLLFLFWQGVYFFPYFSRAQNKLPTPALEEIFDGTDGKWSEYVLDTMSLDSKIGQLFMVAAYSSGPNYNKKDIERLIKQYRIGGIIFMQGTPSAQIAMHNQFQRLSSIPLLVGIDAEWGLRMRLDSTMKFPKNMTLGAIQEDKLIYQYGRELARQCKALGIHINFAPVVDINNNPANPVIHYRSFGDNAQEVSRKGILLMKALQEGGIIACAKHFPGHGDTDIDSHFNLPIIKHTRSRLDSLELVPFQRLIQAGVQSVMVAHLYVPSLDTTSHLPTTFSPKVARNLLQDSLQFHGLIFTDALNMGAITGNTTAGEAEVKALLAGNDILLCSTNVGKGIKAIKKAIEDSLITIAEVNKRVLKILRAKEWAFQRTSILVNPKKAYQVLRSKKAEKLKQQLYRASITLVKNENLILPLQDFANKRIAYLQVGYNHITPFYETLLKYKHLDFYCLSSTDSFFLDSLLLQLLTYEVIIVGCLNMNPFATKNYGLPIELSHFLFTLLQAEVSVITVFFGSPYALSRWGKGTAIILAYEEATDVQIAAAEAIFGTLEPLGRLPVQVPGWNTSSPPLYIYEAPRFGFGLPESCQMNSKILHKIDTLVQEAIQKKVMPGCAILVMRGNTIVYEKGFGKVEYSDKATPIYPCTTAYDLASVTKVIATTLAAMKLYEEKKLDLEQSLNYYLPQIKSKIGKIKILQLLQHRSGLPAWIPFWKQLLKGSTYDTAWVSTTPNDTFSIPLTNGLYLHCHYPDTVFQKLCEVPVQETQATVYSDLNMILLAKVIEKVSGQKLDVYLKNNFYAPLGMDYTFFNPASQCTLHLKIPPTAIDKVFRKTKIQGYVHDENAAILGGVAGHAGLFSTIYDLAKVLLMLKNGGEYGGQCFLTPETIEYFTQTVPKDSRRALGWDKPNSQQSHQSPTAPQASSQTYGHQGFTGTCVWVDPFYDIIYIFLSNRTYPESTNNKLAQQNIRTRIMEIIYHSIFQYSAHEE
ncbi:MAG: glycoside hydrolase family 3 N-terminal domain-containing protein [Bacteroidia bacterium]|nr:serine hydrolase [Bacteroidia bacterium]MDW8157918.1 glycoside hydrolase family 3 N-terminal domain-containing protein [Bacteroidia bacterium]